MDHIIDGLIAQSQAGELDWETGSPSDSFAITVAGIRFRIRSVNGDEKSPFVLDLPGTPQLETEAGNDLRNERLEQLYRIGRKMGPDPLRDVERELGLSPED